MLKAQLYLKLSALIPNEAERFAIAFSGGGDSTALVYALKDHPQCAAVLIVDHALRRGSAKEALGARQFAQSLGHDTHILQWSHDNPKSGIQEKARRARYGLMGEFCRKNKISHLLTAHHQDDQAETLLMRYDRHTDWRGAAGMAEYYYGALWPELAGVGLYRPLLAVSRADLLGYNQKNNLKWAEDPSNQNRDYARIRAREYLDTHTPLKDHLLTAAKDLSYGLSEERHLFQRDLGTADIGYAGEIVFPKFPPLELLAHAMRCVGGSGGVIERDRLGRLYQSFKSGDVKGFTYLGAQTLRHQEGLLICRDKVAVLGRKDRGGAPQASKVALTKSPKVWDGRFLASSKRSGYELCANYDLKIPRSKRLQALMSAANKSVRPCMPVIIHQNMAFSIDERPEIEVKCLARERLESLTRNLTPLKGKTSVN